MMVTRIERRSFQFVEGEARRDCQGRRTQRTARVTCPFCGTDLLVYVWSLCGGGKLCTCGAKLDSGGTATRAVDTGVVVDETPGSRPGRREYEATAPDGSHFALGPHSLVGRDREALVREVRAHEVVRCDPGCECCWDDTDDVAALPEGRP